MRMGCGMGCGMGCEPEEGVAFWRYHRNRGPLLLFLCYCSMAIDVPVSRSRSRSTLHVARTAVVVTMQWLLL